jgi:mRNA interferase MazF
VQDDVLNDSRIETVVVCALTSNLKQAKQPGNVLLEPGEGGLPRQSVVVVSRIDSVPKAQLGDRLGARSPQRVDEVLRGLRFQQASFFDQM